MLYVKMRPHKPGGHRVKRYSCEGVILELGMPWRRVQDDFGEALREVTDRRGNKVFHVCTYEEAQAKDTKDHAVEATQAEVSTPVVLARSDSPGSEELPIPEYEKLSARRIISAVKDGDFEAGELASILTYETVHNGRVTVLRALREALDDTKNKGE